MKRAILLVLLVVAAGCGFGRKPDIVIGIVDRTPMPATPQPTAPPPPADEEIALPPALLPAPGSRPASGPRVTSARPFQQTVQIAPSLLFFLVIGSDARPGQDITRCRADSIHIAAVNPQTRRGTILGIPRDSYVDIPGHGKRKINAALSLGGPQLLAQTVRNLTGIPVSHYGVTGFEGLAMMVDELDGVDIYVRERMDDKDSGARFEEGWHHMDGRQVLAFTRNRHVQGGDFGRSRNHGYVILHTLQKLRGETADAEGLRRWVGILYRHAQLDLPREEAVRLAHLARALVPADLVNVVAPGRSRNVDGQDVVILDPAAHAMFRDVAADGMFDGNGSGVPEPTSTPAPTPTPTPTPLVPVPSELPPPSEVPPLP